MMEIKTIATILFSISLFGICLSGGMTCLLMCLLVSIKDRKQIEIKHLAREHFIKQCDE